MFGFAPKLPISEEERTWLDDGFRRLERMLGKHRLLHASVVLPTVDFFPDPYDKTPAAAEMMFRRVCSYMQVDRSSVDFEVFPDETEELREIMPYWTSKSNTHAGLYLQHHSEPETRMHVAIRSTQLRDPLSLVATMAHELGHVILLGGGLMDNSASDHEPMTDLLTVYLGLGIFTANSAARFTQYSEDGKQGWSTQRLGYLPEEAFGYALAKFAVERKEGNPKWAEHLGTNVRVYLDQSRAWIKKFNSVR